MILDVMVGKTRDKRGKENDKTNKLESITTRKGRDKKTQTRQNILPFISVLDSMFHATESSLSRTDSNDVTRQRQGEKQDNHRQENHKTRQDKARQDNHESITTITRMTATPRQEQLQTRQNETDPTNNNTGNSKYEEIYP